MIEDVVDRKLLRLLQLDGRKTLVELSKELNMSHVAVRKRINKLISSGLLSIKALINSGRFVYAVIIAELSDYEYIDKVINKLKECPRLILLAPLIGGMNLIAIMAFESIEILEACINSCMIRRLEGIKRSDVYISRYLPKPEFIYIEVPESTRDRAPCGAQCNECILYKTSKCPGCPSTKYYRSTLKSG